MNAPYCVDCEKCLKTFGNTNPPVCMDSYVSTDIVSGRKSYTDCRTIRADAKKCGPSGLWFSPENKPSVGKSMLKRVFGF